MKNEIIAILVICFFVIISALFLNVARQRFVCEYPWSECRPTEMVICEPVSKAEAQWKEWEQRAKENPWQPK